MTTKGIVATALAVSLFAGSAAAELAPACGEWQVVPTPKEWGAVEPTAVAALDASNAWAVGNYAPAGPAKDTADEVSAVAMRWDGNAWSMEKLPDLGALGTQPTFQSVDLAPSGDPWVVGHLSDRSGTNLPLILRWSAGFWEAHQVVLLDSFAPRQALLRDVAAITDSDAWAVGEAATIAPTDDRSDTAQPAADPFAARWDGKAWVEVSMPGFGGRRILHAVSAAASNAVWAVGYDVDPATGVAYARIHRFDGAEWSVVDHPATGKAGSVLHDVVALAADDVWAVGVIGNETGLFLHWDGATWTAHASPANASPRSVDGAVSNDVWAVGPKESYRWDGTRWSVSATANRGARRAVTAFGPCAAWAVSRASDGTSLIERLVPSATAPAIPTALVATPRGANEIVLEWLPGGSTNGAGGMTIFIVERCVEDKGECEFEAVHKALEDNTSFVDGNVKPNTSYAYRVYAVNDVGKSEPTKPVSVMTMPEVEEAPVPLPVPTEDPAAKVAPEPVPPMEPLPASDGDRASARASRIPRPVPGSRLPQQAPDTDRSQPSPATGSWAPVTRPAPPSTPVELTVRGVSPKEIAVSWRAGDETPDSARPVFVIERCVATKDGCGTRFIVVGQTGIPLFKDSGLEAASSYAYRVYAVNVAGKSEPTEPVTGFTLPEPPAPSPLPLPAEEPGTGPKS